jgi:ABC-2 type transport system ATP-binding protein
MSEILKIENLTKSFGRKKVLQGLSLSLEKGKVCGLLGKNGEGKTTLIRILMGVIPADEGRIVYAGRPVRFSDAAYKRSIGYIAEDNIFFSRMRIAELLRFNAAFYPQWSPQRAENYLNRFGLSRRDKVRNLSRGMALKLGLAVALGAAPELLILDDPTSGLDVPTRVDFLKNVIREITEAGTTILFATHMVHEAEKIIDRLAVLRGGRLVIETDYEAFKPLMKKIVVRADPEALDKLSGDGILSKDIQGGAASLVVYPWSEATQVKLQALSRAPLETSAPTLEEIFVGLVS